VERKDLEKILNDVQRDYISSHMSVAARCESVGFCGVCRWLHKNTNSVLPVAKVVVY